MQRGRVPSLVRGIRSHMPRGEAPHPLKKATEPNVLIGCRRHIISGCRVNEPHCRSWKKAFAIFFRCVFESLFHQCVFSWKVFKLPKGQFLRFQPGLFYSCKTGKAKVHGKASRGYRKGIRTQTMKVPLLSGVSQEGFVKMPPVGWTRC